MCAPCAARWVNAGALNWLAARAAAGRARASAATATNTEGRYDDDDVTVLPQPLRRVARHPDAFTSDEEAVAAILRGDDGAEADSDDTLEPPALAAGATLMRHEGVDGLTALVAPRGAASRCSAAVAAIASYLMPPMTAPGCGTRGSDTGDVDDVLALAATCRTWHRAVLGTGRTVTSAEAAVLRAAAPATRWVPRGDGAGSDVRRRGVVVLPGWDGACERRVALPHAAPPLGTPVNAEEAFAAAAWASYAHPHAAAALLPFCRPPARPAAVWRATARARLRGWRRGVHVDVAHVPAAQCAHAPIVLQTIGMDDAAVVSPHTSSDRWRASRLAGATGTVLLTPGAHAASSIAAAYIRDSTIGSGRLRAQFAWLLSTTTAGLALSTTTIIDGGCPPAITSQEVAPHGAAALTRVLALRVLADGGVCAISPTHAVFWSGGAVVEVAGALGTLDAVDIAPSGTLGGEVLACASGESVLVAPLALLRHATTASASLALSAIAASPTAAAMNLPPPARTAPAAALKVDAISVVTGHTDGTLHVLAWAGGGAGIGSAALRLEATAHLPPSHGGVAVLDTNATTLFVGSTTGVVSLWAWDASLIATLVCPAAPPAAPLAIIASAPDDVYVVWRPPAATTLLVVRLACDTTTRFLAPATVGGAAPDGPALSPHSPAASPSALSPPAPSPPAASSPAAAAAAAAAGNTSTSSPSATADVVAGAARSTYLRYEVSTLCV